MITWYIINHVALRPPHPGSHGPLSAHENDEPSTTTPTRPLSLRDVGPMASRRHPHCHLITTHRLGRPYQLAPPLVEGCGLATTLPKPSASASSRMSPNEKNTGLHERGMWEDAGKRTRRSPPPRLFFFAHEERVDDAVSMFHHLLVPRHVTTHPPPLAPALSRERHRNRQRRCTPHMLPPRTPSLPTNDPENDAEAAYTPYATSESPFHSRSSLLCPRTTLKTMRRRRRPHTPPLSPLFARD